MAEEKDFDKTDQDERGSIIIDKKLGDLEFVDEIVLVSTKDATDFAKKLAKNGLFIGVSAGANVLASERWLSKNNKKHAITVLCDRGERYFSCL